MLPNLYGISLAFAIFVAYSLTAFRASKRGLFSQFVWDSLPWVLFFGILGARLYHVINYWSYYSQSFILIPQVWLGGLGIFGGLFGGLLGVFLYFLVGENYITLHSVVYFILGRRSWYSPKHSAGYVGYKAFRSYLDAAAPAIALAQAIGRIGNLFNGENLPFAYWEIVADLFIFAVLVFEEKMVCSKAAGSGELFILYLLGYALARFVLEFFRRDSPWIFGPLTVAQWVSLTIILSISLAVISRNLRGRAKGV